MSRRRDRNDKQCVTFFFTARFKRRRKRICGKATSGTEDRGAASIKASPGEGRGEGNENPKGVKMGPKHGNLRRERGGAKGKGSLLRLSLRYAEAEGPREGGGKGRNQIWARLGLQKDARRRKKSTGEGKGKS